MDLAPLITAIGTFFTGIIGATVLLLREMRRVPKARDRATKLVHLVRRIRDWLETEELWDQLPPSLQRDIERTLLAIEELEEEESRE